MSQKGTVHIPIKNIHQNENSRIAYNETDLADLMHSLKQHGLQQAIGVKPMDKKPGHYEVVFGNRRFVAAKKLDWAEIECKVTTAKDDTGRDILNLVENLKRQNTTVAEDGRMFQILLDRGLSPDEICARVGVPKERVQTAVEVWSTVPKELHKSIVNRVTGKKQAGTISATAASSILALKRTQGLTRSQTLQLFKMAKTEGVSTQHILKVAPLVKEGMAVSKAIKTVQQHARYTLQVFTDLETAKRLEKKYEKTFTEIMLERLEKDRELNVSRAIGAGRSYRSKKQYGNG